MCIAGNDLGETCSLTTHQFFSNLLSPRCSAYCSLTPSHTHPHTLTHTDTYTHTHLVWTVAPAAGFLCPWARYWKTGSFLVLLRSDLRGKIGFTCKSDQGRMQANRIYFSNLVFGTDRQAGIWLRLNRHFKSEICGICLDWWSFSTCKPKFTGKTQFPTVWFIWPLVDTQIIFLPHYKLTCSTPPSLATPQ